MDALDLMGLPYAFDRADPGLTRATGGHRLRFDFLVYFGATVVVIEFDGGQHDKPTRFGGRSEAEAEAAFDKQTESDAAKAAYCAAEGFHLLRIPYADLLRAPRLIGDFFRARLNWAPGRPLPPDTPPIPRAPAVEDRESRQLRRHETRPKTPMARPAPTGPTAEELSGETLDLLGSKPFEAVAVDLDVLLSAPVIDLATRINVHAYRLFDISNGRRRSNAIVDVQVGGRSRLGGRRRAVANSLNAVLSTIGGTLIQEYDTARQKNQGKPARYRLQWVDDPPEIAAPGLTVPTHPQV